MGSLFSIVNDSTPQVYSYSQYKQTVSQINTISNRLASYLHFDLTVLSDTLCFNYASWKQSATKAMVGLGPQKRKKLMEERQEGDQVQLSYSEQIEVVLTIKQLYEIYDLLQYFKQEQNMPGGTPSTSTPSSTGMEDKLCEICFNEEPDLALPCGHRFGAQCVSKYIIEKQQKLCPMCRRQFLGRKSQIQRDLFTIIEKDDKSIYDQISSCLLSKLSAGNEEAQQRIASFLKEKKEWE